MSGNVRHHITAEATPPLHTNYPLDLPRLADELAESARRLRVLTARPVAVTTDDLFEVLRD